MSGCPRLRAVLEPGALAVVFQPIVEFRATHRRLHGLEALVRAPKAAGFASAEALFEHARRRGEEGVLDRMAAEAILRTAATLPMRPPLSMNVHASTLGSDESFLALLSRVAGEHSFPLTRLTVEITEHSRPRDERLFQRTLAGLRAAGIAIALDDVGLGYSNGRMILDTLPDYLKVDRYVVAGCHRSPERRALLESTAGLAAALGARVVAEGVELEADLAAVLDLGIDLVQGFFLSRPVSSGDLGRGLEAALTPRLSGEVLLAAVASFQ